MLVPLKQWICDVCGDLIETADEGYVIWKSDGSGKRHSFKIIHQAKCDDNSHGASMHVDRFLGQDGLSYLMTFLTIGPIKLHLEDVTDSEMVVRLDEFADFVRRLQLPYYEEARKHFLTPDALDRYGDATEFAPYTVDKLRKFLLATEED